MMDSKWFGTAFQALTEVDLGFKVVIIGDSGVGKTSLLDRFTNRVFGEIITSTLCVDFKIRKVDVDNKVVKLYMWDTAGQERYVQGMPLSYYRRVNGILFAFDIANIKSFQNIGKWITDFDEKNSDTVAKVLVGTKSDLEAQRVVSHEMAKEYADQIGVPYIETSAKTDNNVDQTFLKIAEEMKKNFDSGAADVYQTYKPNEFQDVGRKKGSLGYYLCSC